MGCWTKRRGLAIGGRPMRGPKTTYLIQDKRGNQATTNDADSAAAFSEAGYRVTATTEADQ